jgi:protein TonB
LIGTERIVSKKKSTNPIVAMLHALAVLGGAIGLTLLFFLVLPLMQSISEPDEDRKKVQEVSAGDLEPPPPPPEEEEPDEEEPEEIKPELTEAPPLDLSQLEIALGGSGTGLGIGSFTPQINTGDLSGGMEDLLENMADLDQKPRIVYQPGPMLDAKLRKAAPATVYVIFIVNKNGRVESPKVQKSSNPIFDRSAINAVKQWKFEPGMRGGEPVRFRMKVPITFPRG